MACPLKSNSSQSCGILFLLLVVFAMSSLAQEILYQRIFWLVLGAVLAQPLASYRQA